MISVSFNNYLTVIRAAETEAIRTGLPMDGKQSMAVAIDTTAPPPAPPISSAATMTGQIINVTV